MGNWRKAVLAGCASVAAALTIIGCGGAGQNLNVTRAYLGTQAPGDVWSWNILESTFTATNETNGYTYSGSKADLPTGFMKLTILSTTDPNVTNGQAAYALELPGTALIIKPAGDDTNPPITAGSLGSNPPGPTVTFNFVHVPKVGWTLADEAYGHVAFTVTGNRYQGTSNNFLLDGTPLSDTPSDITGDNGRMTTTTNGGAGTATGSMTPSGVCVLDYGPGQGGVIGVKAPAQNVDLAVIGGKTFKGFLINGGKTQCVSCTPNGDGTLHGLGYSSPDGVENGTSDGGSGVTVTFVSQDSPGLIHIRLDTSGGTENLVACVAQVDGKYMLFGFAKGSDAAYNVILVEH